MITRYLINRTGEIDILLVVLLAVIALIVIWGVDLLHKRQKKK